MVRRELAEKVFRKEAMGCGFIASGYLCFEEDNDAQVALRELMDKKMIQAPVNGRFAPGAYEAVISLLPALIVFVCCQKQIYSGITAGAVKG